MFDGKVGGPGEPVRRKKGKGHTPAVGQASAGGISPSLCNFISFQAWKLRLGECHPAGKGPGWDRAPGISLPSVAATSLGREVE